MEQTLPCIPYNVEKKNQNLAQMRNTEAEICHVVLKYHQSQSTTWLLTLMISTSWSTPLSPGKIGWPKSSSAKTQPADHTSEHEDTVLILRKHIFRQSCFFLQNLMHSMHVTGNV